MRFATPEQWLAWLENLHPTAIDLGLERVSEVWRRMGLGLGSARTISVAGTNGKGSSVAYLESIYRAAGYSTAAYTSPHLLRYNERIRLDGEPVDDADLCEAFAAVDQARGEISLTYFEFGTLAALYLFSRQGPDVVVLEVGLGGRLDAVNIIDADVALITTVARDHEAWLGSDIDQIAREKAGIMRSGHPAVFAGDQPPTAIVQVAGELGAKLIWRGRDYTMKLATDGWSWRMDGSRHEALPYPLLPGAHQVENAAAVLSVVELLKGELPVSSQALRQGLTGAVLGGRFQIISGEVDMVLDVAHNPQAAVALADTLAKMPCEGRTLAVFGILADKDAAGVVEPLTDLVDVWHVATADSQRAMPVSELQRILRSAGLADAAGHRTIADAFHAARDQALSHDRVVIFGSFYTLAEVMGLL